MIVGRATEVVVSVLKLYHFVNLNEQPQGSCTVHCWLKMYGFVE